MWSAKDICLCCMCKAQDYNKLNEIVVEQQSMSLCDILYKTVPPLEQINKQNLDQFTLPDIICSICHANLMIAHKFQEQCLASLQSLYKLLAEHQLETPVSTLEELQANEEVKTEKETHSEEVQSEIVLSDRQRQSDEEGENTAEDLHREEVENAEEALHREEVDYFSTDDLCDTDDEE